MAAAPPAGEPGPVLTGAGRTAVLAVLGLVLGLVGLGAAPPGQAAPAGCPTEARDLVFTRIESGRVTLTWDAPTSPGASAVTGYDVRVGAGEPVRVPAAPRSFTAVGVPPNDPVSLAVRAVNAQCAGDWVWIDAVSGLPPGPPTGLGAVATSDGTSLTATWSAPVPNGEALNGYEVSLDGVLRYRVADPTRSATFSDLVPGRTYVVSVTAGNRAGASAPVSVQVTTPDPDALPGRPTITSGDAGRDGRSYTLVWAPGNDRIAPLGFRVAVDGVTVPGDLPGDARSFTWTGLRPGTTYALSVRAFSAGGEGEAATVTVRTLTTTPSAPTGFTVTPAADGRAATATWGAPTDDGGSPVTGYRIGLAGGDTRDAAGPPYTWSGLTPGATYAFSVAARNEASGSRPGEMAYALVTMPDPTGATTTPAPIGAGVPTQPGAAKARSGARGGATTVRVRWSLPEYDGGTAVTGYRVVATRLDRRGRPVDTLTSALLPATPLRAQVPLPHGRYRLAVVAVNAIGTSAAGPRSRVVRAR